ncbi:MAG: hypothetical protein ABWW69_06565 [Pyrodictiaceae archaeon]
MLLLSYDTRTRRTTSHLYNEEGKLVKAERHEGIEMLVFKSVKRLIYRPGIDHRLLTFVVEAEEVNAVKHGRILIVEGRS